VFNNLLKVSKTLVSKCVKPAIELAKKAFQPQINNIKNSSLGKVAAKLLPVVNSPAVTSTVIRIQKALAVPKTVTPVKKEIVSATQTSNKTQVNQPKVYNTSLSTMEKIVKLIDVYNTTEVNKREDIIRGQLKSNAFSYVIDMSLNNPMMPGYIKVLRGMMPQKYKSDYLKLTYELFQIVAKNQFNQAGNDVYNAQIPVISNLIGSFTNSSDYKEYGPLPLESVKTNHYLAIINWAMYSNAAGGYLNQGDWLTTMNNMMNNTNMSSVIGANAGGALIDGGVGMADSLIELALDPNEFMKNLYTLIKDSPVIVPALLNKMYEYSDHFVYEAKPQEKARIEGRIAFELFSFVALSALGKASEGAKTTQELQKLEALAQAEKEASTINKSSGVLIRTVEEEAVVGGKSAATVVEEGVSKVPGNAGKAIEGAGKLKPSLTDGSKPIGKYSPPNSPGLIRQNETADLLASKGYKVEMLEEVPGGNGYGIKPNSNPDFLIEDKVFDCYAPKVDTNTKGIVKEIYNKTKKQTPNIVVNLDDYAGNIPELTDSLLAKIDGDLKYLQELYFVKDGEIIHIFGR
jgi:hypothetical protein